MSPRRAQTKTQLPNHFTCPEHPPRLTSPTNRRHAAQLPPSGLPVGSPSLPSSLLPSHLPFTTINPLSQSLPPSLLRSLNIVRSTSCAVASHQCKPLRRLGPLPLVYLSPAFYFTLTRDIETLIRLRWISCPTNQYRYHEASCFQCFRISSYCSPTLLTPLQELP